MKQSSSEDIEQNLDHEESQIEVVFKFNQSPRKNIKALCEFFNVQQTPEQIAHLMRQVPGLLGSAIGDYLSREENEPILAAYFNELNLKVPFIQAMRDSLSGPMYLPGEAQQIDRVVQTFSNCYLAQNPDNTKFSDPDAPYVLAFALIMLNSDLHNQNVKRRMTLEDFIRNTTVALGSHAALSREYLTECFESIRENEFHFLDTSNKFMSNVAPKLRGPLRKKTKHFGSAWTSHYFVLTSSCLYYFKNDKDPDQTPLGNIQLVGVDVNRTSPLQMQLHARSNKGIQYVKFKKGPQYQKGINEILLEAPNKHQMDKWYAWIKKSTLMSGLEGEAVTTFGSALGQSDSVSPVNNDESDISDSSLMPDAKNKTRKGLLKKKESKDLKNQDKK